MSGFVQSAVPKVLWALDLTSMPVLDELVEMEEVEDGWRKVVQS